MDYPHKTYVLDDGRRDEVRKIAESLGVHYITRDNNLHAKAGNVNNAMKQTEGEFVIILDSDHIPHKNFISRLIGYFEQADLGYVQAPHTTYNFENYLGSWNAKTSMYWEDVRIFYEAVQLGKNRDGVACFCGSAAMFRRKALEDVGLFATETITEDLHTGMKINAAGWKSIAVSEELVAGLAPEDPETFATQRLRWGEGNLSILAFDNPLTMKGLSLSGRINYLGAIFIWTYGPARMLLYLTPIIMLLSGIAPLANLSYLYLAVVAFYLACVWTAVSISSNGCGDMIGIETAMMSSFSLQTKACWRALFRRRKQKFVVTSKKRAKTKSKARVIWAPSAILLLGIIAVVWGGLKVIFGLSIDYFGLIIGGILIFYHCGLSLKVITRALRPATGEEEWQHLTRLPITFEYEDHEFEGVLVQFNENNGYILLWDDIPIGEKIDITIHSPVLNTTCSATIHNKQQLPGLYGLGYVCEVKFANGDGEGDMSNADKLSDIAFSYVVPSETYEHRSNQRWNKYRKSRRQSDNAILPLPVQISSNDPAIPRQRSIARIIGQKGFVSTLSHSLVEGDTYDIRLSTPYGIKNLSARVQSVHTIRIGSNVLYRHVFFWPGNRIPADSGLDEVMRAQVPDRFPTAQKNTLRKFRVWTTRSLLGTAAMIVLTVATFSVFFTTFHNDLLMLASTERILTPDENVKLTNVLQMVSQQQPSTHRLLRAYAAAEAANEPALAAKFADELSDRIKPDRYEWMATAARHYVQAGDYETANRLFTQVLFSDAMSNFTEDEKKALYIEAARTAVEVKDYNAAVNWFIESSDLMNLSNSEMEEFIGILVSSGNVDETLRILRQRPRTDNVLRWIIAVYDKVDEPQKAAPEIRELYNRHPDDYMLLRRLAILAFDSGNYQQAAQYYTKLDNYVKTHPEVPESVREFAQDKLAETYFMIARQEVAQSKPQEAIQWYDKAQGILTLDNNQLLEYAGVLTSAGRLDTAVDLLSKMDTPQSNEMLASILEMAGRNEAALAILQSYAQEFPDDPTLKTKIARLMLATGQYGQSLEYLTPLVQEDPGNEKLASLFIDAAAAAPLPYLTNESMDVTQNIFQNFESHQFDTLTEPEFERLGDVLRRFSKYEEARDTLKAGAERYKDNRIIKLRLAETYGQLGDYRQAEKVYQQLLSTVPK